MLTRPCDRCIEQAGDSDSARQPTIDSGLDEAWRQKGKRDRHMNVALAAGFTFGDGVDRRGAGLDLGEPVSYARDRGDELDPGVGADRAGFGVGRDGFESVQAEWNFGVIAMVVLGLLSIAALLLMPEVFTSSRNSVARVIYLTSAEAGQL
jgi:hypothetical protein